MTQSPRGAASKLEIQEYAKQPGSCCFHSPPKPKPQAPRRYSQAEIIREAWAIAYELEELKRFRQRRRQ